MTQTVPTAGDRGIPPINPLESWGVRFQRPGVICRFRRAIAVLKYHHPSQLLGRGWKICRNRWEALRCGGRYAIWPDDLPTVRIDSGLKKFAERKLFDCRQHDTRDRSIQFSQGHFQFLGQEVVLRVLDATLTGQGELPLLWRFKFHYHEYLLDAAYSAFAASERSRIQDVWRFTLSWIDNYPLSNSKTHVDAWHPFCISRRLAVWISLWLNEPPAPESQPRILGSLLQQARYLSAHLEWDLGGNHLLENLRTLALCSAFLNCPDNQRWLKQLQVIPYQLRAQILGHGEHFERCPMYHALTLEAVLDIRDALCKTAPKISAICGRAALDMAEFLDQILAPDGELPLLGDTAGKEAPSPHALIAAAEPSHPEERSPDAEAMCVGPYWIWNEADGNQLLFDAGPVGADSLPAHAHSDLLNLEISLGGIRFVVDSGVFNYSDDLGRQYCRSTAAHNTLEIDGENQCDTWSRFRMGERGWPTPLSSGEDQGFAWASASHDAYRRLNVPTVTRWIACCTGGGGPWFIVDAVFGEGTHRIKSRLHFHPHVTVIPVDESRVTLEAGSERWQLIALGHVQLSVENGWYCPEFGKRTMASVVTWESTSSLPSIGGWCLSRSAGLVAPKLEVDRNETVHVRWSREVHTYHWAIPRKMVHSK